MSDDSYRILQEDFEKIHKIVNAKSNEVLNLIESSHRTMISILSELEENGDSNKAKLAAIHEVNRIKDVIKLCEELSKSFMDTYYNTIMDTYSLGEKKEKELYTSIMSILLETQSQTDELARVCKERETELRKYLNK